MSDNKQAPQPVPAAKQSVAQTLLVIALVILVGIIFGIGQSSLTMAFETKAVVEAEAGLTNVDYQTYTRIRTIESLLYRGQKPHEVEDQVWAQAENFTQMFLRYRNPLLIAKLGELRGLKPEGEELDRLVEEYLNRPLSNKDYPTLGHAFKAVSKANIKGRTVNAVELRNYIANEQAATNLESQNQASLVIDREAAASTRAIAAETITVEEATISTAALIAKYKEEVVKDEDALLIRYDELKDDRFVIPRRCHLTLIGVDANTLRESVTISDEEIGAYYEKNKEIDPMLKKVAAPEEPKEGEAPPAPKMESKTLAESRAYIRGKLQGEKADEVALDLCSRFLTAVSNESLIEEDRIAEGKHDDLLSLVPTVTIAAADDERLDKDVSLTLWTKMGADEPQSGSSYQIQDAEGKHVASMNVENPSLFQKEPGSILLRAQAIDNPQLHVFQVIEGFTDSSYKDFDAVKDEVILYESAQRAYAELREEAEAIKTALARSDASFAKYFEAEERKHWAAAIDSQTYAPLDEIVEPMSAEGGLGDKKPAIAHTVPGHGVYLKEAENDGDMRRITIGRVVKFESSEDPEKDIDYAQHVQFVERTVRGLQQQAFSKTIQAALSAE